MNAFGLKCVFVALFLGVLVSAQGVDQDAVKSAIGAGAAAVHGLPSIDEEPGVDIDFPCSKIEDPETRERCYKAYRARFEYYEKGLEHRESVFWWQTYASRVIFVFVLALVVFGAALAWIQFQRSTPTEGVGPAERVTASRCPQMV